MDPDYTSPEELKMIALQFMGQQIGELKELDKNIINRTNSLQGNQINVQQVLKTLPQSNAQHRPQQQTQSVRSQPSVTHVVQSNPASDYFDKILAKLDTIIKLLEK